MIRGFQRPELILFKTVEMTAENPLIGHDQTSLQFVTGSFTDLLIPLVVQTLQSVFICV